MTIRRCDKCEWWERIPVTVNGQCHLNPPTPAIYSGVRDTWPETKEQDHCSHFTAKREPRPIEPSEREKEEILRGHWRDMDAVKGPDIKPDNPPEPALKPCPFCGGHPRWSGMAGRAVLCPKCGSVSGIHNTNSEAATAWNKRTP